MFSRNSKISVCKTIVIQALLCVKCLNFYEKLIFEEKFIKIYNTGTRWLIHKQLFVMCFGQRVLQVINLNSFVVEELVNGGVITL